MNKIPFDPKELNPVLVEPPTMPGFPEKVIYDSPISIKENYFLSLKRETPLWMPNSFFDFTMICPENPDNIARAFVFEKKPMDRNNVGGKDMFGVDWEFVPSVGGSMVRGGNPKIPDITEWEKYITIPDPKNVMDWEGVSARNKDFCDPRKPLEVTILNGLFERLISFMDMQNALIALVDEDEQAGVHRLFDKLCDFYDEYIHLYKKYFDCDIIAFHDDWGSQKAPFFSLATVREMLLPYLKRVVDSTHDAGCFFEMHSCGKNDLLVPAMVEAGIDCWQPQFINDFELLYKMCGDEIALTIPLMDYIRKDMEENEMRDAISAFIENHPKAMGSTWMAPDISAKYLYEISRKYYCG